jgi:hypothetical protein
MTAALLDRTVARILARNRITTASLQQRQNLAAIIHLCGDGAGDGYARRGFRFRSGQRCGDHDPRRYLAQVNALKRQFARLAAADVRVRPKLVVLAVHTGGGRHPTWVSPPP